MKARLTVMFLLLLAIVCSGCNSVGVSGKNLAGAILPHPYKFEEKDRQKILDSGLAIVSLYFAPEAKTSWKRAYPDGRIGAETFTLTYSDSMSSGRRESKLPPGTYFLNGILFSDGEKFHSLGSEADSVSDKVYGWDRMKREPRCFSFTLRPGQDLFIPDVEVSPNTASGTSMCPRLTVKESEDWSPPYQIGAESRIDD